MPKVSVNGIGLYYEEHGQGYPVLFIHGFAGTTNMWAGQVPVLSQHYRFITLDARGHGQSESPPTVDRYAADTVVEDIYQLLLHLKVNKAVVGGLSMGGYLSLRFYLRHPEVVGALILMDTGPGYRNAERRAEWNQSCEQRARILETEGIAGFTGRPETAEMDAYTPRELMLKHNPVGLAHMIRMVVGQHDPLVIENLANIKVPTMVLVGEKDTPYLTATDYMVKTIPGAKKAVIPGAGHASNVDNPQAFNKAVVDFLADLHLG
ncbi:MAG: alpha/beta fold hydrolase [Chloroflexi bacterium]|nr:alpha/beta fold hydrolase [Chloroflexota bacterium]